MEFKEFVRRRREELGISQQELADRLSQRGQETSYGRISHWETGRNKPPLEDPKFRQALASALEMDSNELLFRLGYISDIASKYSREARIAADIIERLPQDQRRIALALLNSLEKELANSN
jgi:transcriptional regulator with XRE-family HTH domain